VLVFVPVLMALYFALAVLEDSGYMARAAFVMDRLMHSLGLHGKSFLPMIVGFGCTVPAIYATRTLDNEKDRILTGLLVPFMSCGARLPVYVLFASIFFPQNSGMVIFGLYVFGIAVAVLIGVLLKHTVFKNKESSLFVMELPPYRMPTLKSIWFHLWERTSAFIRKAWSIILITSVAIWILLAIPTSPGGSFNDSSVDQSAFASVSSITAPLFKPLGFGEWEASGSLITGFVAKEVVVGTMSQVYGVEEGAEEAAEPTTFGEDLIEVGTSFFGAAVDTIKSVPLIVGIDLFEGEEEEEMTDLMVAVEDSFEQSSGGHGALAAMSFMLFVLLYTPCMVAVAAQRQEFGAKWMWVSIVGQLIIAWVISFIAYQGGILLGLG
jgi:ferrous iron transport protein B